MEDTHAQEGHRDRAEEEDERREGGKRPNEEGKKPKAKKQRTSHGNVEARREDQAKLDDKLEDKYVQIS